MKYQGTNTNILGFFHEISIYGTFPWWKSSINISIRFLCKSVISKVWTFTKIMKNSGTIAAATPTHIITLDDLQVCCRMPKSRKRGLLVENCQKYKYRNTNFAEWVVWVCRISLKYSGGYNMSRILVQTVTPSVIIYHLILSQVNLGLREGDMFSGSTFRSGCRC